MAGDEDNKKDKKEKFIDDGLVKKGFNLARRYLDPLYKEGQELEETRSRSSSSAETDSLSGSEGGFNEKPIIHDKPDLPEPKTYSSVNAKIYESILEHNNIDRAGFTVDKIYAEPKIETHDNFPERKTSSKSEKKAKRETSPKGVKKTKIVVESIKKEHLRNLDMSKPSGYFGNVFMPANKNKGKGNGKEKGL